MTLKRNTTPQKGSIRRIAGKIYYYAGRTLYPSKAHLVKRELQEQGMGVKLLSDRERGTLIYTTKPSYPDLSEQFTSSYWNPKRRSVYRVLKIKRGEWHGYAMGMDVYGKSKSEVLDKMYRMEHGGISRQVHHRRNPEMKKVYSNFPIIPTLLGSFLGFWVGNKVKPPTETVAGGGTIGALVGAVGGFFVGRKIPAARIANPRKNSGTKWHEDRADHLRYLRRRLEPGSFADEVQGKVNENRFAAGASRRLGMNPKEASLAETLRYFTEPNFVMSEHYQDRREKGNTRHKLIISKFTSHYDWEHGKSTLLTSSDIEKVMSIVRKYLPSAKIEHGKVGDFHLTITATVPSGVRYNIGTIQTAHGN